MEAGSRCELMEAGVCEREWRLWRVSESGSGRVSIFLFFFFN